MKLESLCRGEKEVLELNRKLCGGLDLRRGGPTRDTPTMRKHGRWILEALALDTEF